MISFIRGIVEDKGLNWVTVEVNGIGYQVSVPSSTYEKLPAVGENIKIYVWESTSMYGGNTVLYGFLTQEEREIFHLLRSVSTIGPKGASEILSKISNSLPDFKQAILEKDTKILTKIFGITKKTAEKLVVGLKDKVENLTFKGEQKFALKELNEIADAVSALESLGCRKLQAKQAVNSACEVLKGKFSTEDLIKQALRYL